MNTLNEKTTADASVEVENECSALVCDLCMRENLSKKVGVAQCSRCAQAYCIHFSSLADAEHYCVSCLSDIEMHDEIVTKTVEHYNEETDKTTRRSRSARQITMGGLDWLFVQRKIYDYSDAELMLAIEYHGQRKQLLEKEQERRKLEKAHRYAGVKVQNIALSPVTQSTTTVHVSKKTTSTKSTKAAAQATALIASLLANGTSLDDLLGKVKKP